MIKNNRLILFPVIIVYLFFSLAVMLIQPFGDDWGMIAEPEWFLGVGPVYRPLEHLFGLFAIKFPWTFPYLNHFVILVCHGLNTYMVYRLIQKFNVAQPTAFYCSIFFLFMPSVMGAVTSIDGTNQVISTFYSLLGFFAYIKFQGFKKFFLWLLLTMIAAMHKEIGITWFIGTPLLAYIISNQNETDILHLKKFRPVIPGFILGVSFVIVYFIIRINTSISGLIGSVDPNRFPNYSITFGKNIFINVGLLLGSASTAIDTVALFGYPRNMSLVVLTILLSMPFLILTIVRFYTKTVILNQWRLILLLLLFSVIVISPHLVMGRCGELHAYSVALPYTILLAVLFNGIKTTRLIYVVLISFGISVIIADAHKIYGSYMNGYYGLKIINDINKKTKNIPSRIRVINISYNNLPVPYSSFYQDEKMTYNPSLLKTHYYNKIEKLDNIRLSASDKHLKNKIDSTVKLSVQEGYHAVWIIDGTNVQTIDSESYITK